MNKNISDIYRLKTIPDENRTITEFHIYESGMLENNDNLVGTFFYDLVHPDDVKNAQQIISKLRPSNSSFQYNCSLVKDSEQQIIFVEKGHGVFDNKGDLKHIESVLFALEETKQGEMDQNLEMNRELIKQLIEGSPIPMFVINLFHQIVYWNHPCELLTGVQAGDVIGTNKHWNLFYKDKRPTMADLILEDDPEEMINKWYGDKVKPSNILHDTFEGEDYYSNLGNNGLWLHFTVRPIRGVNDKIIGAVETIQDITEQKNILHRVTEIEARNRYFFDNVGDIIYTHNLEGILTSVNPYGLSLYGYEIDEIVNHPISLIVDADYIELAREMISKKMEGQDNTGPYELLTHTRTGNAIWLEVNSRLVIKDNKPVEIVGVARNITGRKREERLFHALNLASQAMNKSLTEFDVIEKVAQELKILGYSVLFFKFSGGNFVRLIYAGLKQDLIDKIESILKIKVQDYEINIDKVKVLKTVVNDKQSVYHTDLSGLLKEILPFYLHLFIPKVVKVINFEKFITAPIIIDDEVIGYFSVLTNDLQDSDIPTISAFANQIATAWKNASLYEQVQQELSERIVFEQEIEKSLREKEVLLKEIHHRVKNNLQIILSLLNLQSRHADNDSVLEAFQIAKDRIQSIALVHERLYQSQDLINIDFKEYIQKFVEYLFSTYEITGNISLEVNVGDIELDIDNAIPCGLLINELVTNSLKHAFPNNRKGKLIIEMSNDSDGMNVLKVCDNGIGFKLPADELEHNSKLGMNISQVLVRQLNGTFDIINENGTKFICRFKGV